jgi:hypothetical protein
MSLGQGGTGTEQLMASGSVVNHWTLQKTKSTTKVADISRTYGLKEEGAASMIPCVEVDGTVAEESCLRSAGMRRGLTVHSNERQLNCTSNPGA